MISVTIRTTKTTFERTYSAPVTAAKVLADVGIFQPHPCGGRGTCRKCRILLNGQPVPACQTEIHKDATIDYTDNSAAMQGITDGFSANFEKLPLIESGYGAAIDIGTTTIAGYVYHFPSGRQVHAACVPNPQSTFGADVISRIDAFRAGHGDNLRIRVQNALHTLVANYPIQKWVITGNTAMLHLLAGRDPSAMAVAPYHAEHLFGEWQNNTWLMPCISAYVGADITAAVLASGMDAHPTALLIDIGTNGEMVLKHNDTLLCCATAAGPCFEGAGISCGVPAIPGAICRVWAENGALQFDTVAHEPPVGLCGTGLVDAIAVLLKLGLIDETGYLEESFRFGDSDVLLTPKDIRQFQLAKSAIRSGLDTLLHVAEISPSAIDAFYIAGGFGSALNIDSAVQTGLIPAELAGAAVSIGNGAGAGAAMVLQSRPCMETAVQIAARAKAVTLAENAFFTQRYAENMLFSVEY